MIVNILLSVLKLKSFQIYHELQPGIFVNVPRDDSIEVVDGQKLDVTAKMSNTAAHYNYAMALDENNHSSL